MLFSTIFMSEFAKLPICLINISFGMMTLTPALYGTKGGINEERKIYNSLI